MNKIDTMSFLRYLFGVSIITWGVVAHADISASPDIIKLNNQLQIQIKQIQDQQQEQTKQLNAQSLQQFEQLQTQIQTLNTQMQAQLKALKDSLEQEIHQIHQQQTTPSPSTH